MSSSFCRVILCGLLLTALVLALALHDALPIYDGVERVARGEARGGLRRGGGPVEVEGQQGVGSVRLEGAGALGRAHEVRAEDRKSTRLNSSHITISYAVFCLKKKIPSLACSC